MDLSECYEGNFEELRFITEEIRQHHILTSARAEELSILQRHKDYVLMKLREQSKGGPA